MPDGRRVEGSEEGVQLVDTALRAEPAPEAVRLGLGAEAGGRVSGAEAGGDVAGAETDVWALGAGTTAAGRAL
ncbi:hypothetical protein ACWGLF_35050 [Streptomyces puniciscabiei]